MKLNINDLKRLIESVVDSEECVECSEINPIEETVFGVNSKDPKMADKINKIKNDSSLFDKTKDKIVIDSKDGDDIQLESYTKGEIMYAISEAKKHKGGNEDYIKAVKKADRELEYELNGPGWKQKDKIHKNKKQYDRKSKRYDETVMETTVGDIMNKILESKYDGIVYSGSEFKNKLLK